MTEHESGWDRVRALASDAGAGAEVAVAARVVGTGQCWSHGGDRPFPAASTIKLAILAAMARALDAGSLDLTTPCRVEAAAKVPGSGVLAWLGDGLTLPVGDLAYLMVAVSDNTASNLLLDAVGTEAVRATIADLGLAGTALNRRFLGRTPGPGEPENFTCADSLVSLLCQIGEGRAASPARCAWMRDLLGLQQDRDRLARRLPPGYGFGGKSGTLPGLAHDAGLIAAPGGTLAVAVLTRSIADPYASHELIGQIALATLAAAGLG